MASLIFKTIIIWIVRFIFKTDQNIKFSIVHIFCNNIIRILMKQIQNIIHLASMFLKQLDQAFNKFIFLHIIMDVLAAFLRNVEAKSLRFVCRNNLSQLLCDHHRKVVQTLLHLICIITRTKKMIQRADNTGEFFLFEIPVSHGLP